MRNNGWIGLIFLLVINVPTYAFNSVDEQIDHYLGILEDGSYAFKVQMLERLQWSGLSDPRLYDEVERQLFEKYLRAGLDKEAIGLLSHQIRALGYSGNEKYRNSLAQIKKKSTNEKFRRHASKALNQLDKSKSWNKLIADSSFTVEGKSVEVATYMKMLSVDDVFVQRNAARAIFHERQRDPDLLALTAEKLEQLYMQDDLDNQTQDTAAWFCKAIGESGESEYGVLLSKVAGNTPYKKIRNYAQNYAQ